MQLRDLRLKEAYYHLKSQNSCKKQAYKLTLGRILAGSINIMGLLDLLGRILWARKIFSGHKFFAHNAPILHYSSNFYFSPAHISVVIAYFPLISGPFSETGPISAAAQPLIGPFSEIGP